jgi:RNA polymerase sigma-70 factor (ECF subfamily)
MEEAELIKSSRQGDIHAFNILVERYQKEALSFAVYMMGNVPDAEDICQDSWMAAWKDIKHFKKDNFRSWVFSIVANDCRDEFRRRKKRNRILSIGLSPQDVIDSQRDSIRESVIIDAIREALLELPHEQRLALILHEFNGLNYDDIAEVMRCKKGTVCSRLNRGRINLMNVLRDKGFLE